MFNPWILAIMKIGVLLDKLITAGPEKIAVNQVLALRKLGIDSKLIVLSRENSDVTAYSDITNKIDVIYLSDKIPSILKHSRKFPLFTFFSWFHITFALFIPFLISKKDFDVIISHGTYSCFSAIALLLTKRIPYIFYLYDPAKYILEIHYAEWSKHKHLMNFLTPIAGIVDRLVISQAVGVITSSKLHIPYTKKYNDHVFFIPPSANVVREPAQRKKNFVVLATAWKVGREPELVIELSKIVKDIKFVVVV